jgi:hypothetical protein
VFTFPLLLVPAAIYNMVVFITPGVEWTYRPYVFTLRSGVEWGPTIGDALLVFTLLMLMFEFIKATSNGKSLIEHFLSIVLAGAVAAEFVMVKEAGASLFALIVAICFVDMFAGFAASLRRARRVQVVAPVATTAHVEPRAEPVRPEPPPVAPPVRVDPVHVEPAPVIVPPVARVEPATKIEP